MVIVKDVVKILYYLSPVYVIMFTIVLLFANIKTLISILIFVFKHSNQMMMNKIIIHYQLIINLIMIII